MSARQLIFDIIANNKVGRAARDASADFTGMGKVAAGVAGGIVGAFAAVQIKDLFTDAIAEARESAQVTRLTENAITQTGASAWTTADQIGDLATAISNKIGVDDEAIQSSANLLLTFKNVRNEAGQGANVFDRATAAAQDMAAAGFGSAEGASIMLGKALNDPIAGITALGRAGVTFTDQQKDQIEAMVKAGDVLGAQKIILGEVESQVGGAAAAAADPMQKLGVVVGNLKERFGTWLLPIVERVSGFLSGTLVPAVQGVWDILANGDFTSEFGQALGIAEDSGFVNFLFNVREGAIRLWGEFQTNVLPRLREFASWVAQEVIPRLQAFASWVGQNVVPALQTLGGWITGTGIPALSGMVTWVRQNYELFAPMVAVVLTYVAAMRVWAAIQAVVRVATIAWTAVQWALNVALNANPIGLIILAIAALVGIIIWAWNHVDWFRNGLTAAWNWIREKTGALVQGVSTFFGQMGDRIREVWTNITTWASNLWTSVTGFFGRLKDGVVRAFQQVLSWGRQVFSWTPLGMIITNWDKILGFFRGLPARMGSAVSGLWNGISSGFKSAVNTVIRGWNGLQFRIGGQTILGVTLPSFTIDTPNLPLLASGGVATRATLAVVGEGRSSEAILPFDRADEFAAMVAGNLNRGGGGNETVRFHPDDLAVLAELVAAAAERTSVRVVGGSLESQASRVRARVR